MQWTNNNNKALMGKTDTTALADIFPVPSAPPAKGTARTGNCSDCGAQGTIYKARRRSDGWLCQQCGGGPKRPLPPRPRRRRA